MSKRGDTKIVKLDDGTDRYVVLCLLWHSVYTRGDGWLWQPAKAEMRAGEDGVELLYIEAIDEFHPSAKLTLDEAEEQKRLIDTELAARREVARIANEENEAHVQSVIKDRQDMGVEPTEDSLRVVMMDGKYRIQRAVRGSWAHCNVKWTCVKKGLASDCYSTLRRALRDMHKLAREIYESKQSCRFGIYGPWDEEGRVVETITMEESK